MTDEHVWEKLAAIPLMRRFLFGFALASALACAQTGVRAGDLSIIPNPASIVPGEGAFMLGQRTSIIVPPDDPQARNIALYLADLLRRTHGPDLKVRIGDAADGAVVLNRRADAVMGDEAYIVDVTPRRITITASTSAGLFYGETTLWQLLTPANGRQVPAVRITDAPRFLWRGLMLDSARHFQSPDAVKRLIDWMALHKLNRFHWHLTDDQGWRVEIKKYPLLTQIGAWRISPGEAAAHDLDPVTGRPRQYGGFYTQSQVRDIVAYAAARNITIVPEIEMPGHAQAAIIAYPRLGSVDHPSTPVSSDWGVFPYLYNVDDSTFGFLQDVLTEIMALFPGQYIHVGGDEAVKDQWKASPKIQAHMRSLGIDNEDALQTYFIRRVEAFLNAHGRRLIGWDEILQGGIAPNATIMSWRGIDGAVAAVRQGHDAILTPAPTLYLDNRQSTAAEEPPGRGRVISLKDIYGFDPVPSGLGEAERAHILGVQANIWTEHIRTENQLTRMAFPRAAAVSEIGWSLPERLGWASFTKRLPAELARYAALGLAYDSVPFQVQAEAEADMANNQTTVNLSVPLGLGEIRYTLDGSPPTAASPLYARPLTLALPTHLRAASFQDGAPLTASSDWHLDEGTVQRRASQQLTLCSDKFPLSLEGDAMGHDVHPIFLVDLANPCWIYSRADLTRLGEVEVSVGKLPFNFQLGADRDQIRPRAKPRTKEGELEIRLDGCAGDPVAVVPLKPAASKIGVTTLSARLAGITGKHDLCISFAPHGIDPIWAVDWVRLVPAPGQRTDAAPLSDPRSRR